MNAWLARAVCITVLVLTNAAEARPQAASAPANSPAVTITPDKVLFERQAVGTAGSPQTVTYANTGTVMVTISDVLTSGIDFAQHNNCGKALAPGASCSIELTFKPAIPGERLGTLNIIASDPASPHLIALTGTGQ